MIRFNNVRKTYPNGTQALKGLSFELKDGEFAFLVGPSGAGKSTILSLLTAEEPISGGKDSETSGATRWKGSSRLTRKPLNTSQNQRHRCQQGGL